MQKMASVTSHRQVKSIAMAPWRLVKAGLTAGVFVLLSAGGSVAWQRAAHKPPQVTSPSSARTISPAVSLGMSVESQQALVKQYCSGCHNDRVKSGGMSIAELDLAHPEKTPELAEKVIRKLTVGLMPPAGNPRPAADVMKAFRTSLEVTMDRTAALHPNPGSRPFQRLTRTEYGRSVHDLLGIDEDVTALLPPDSLSGEGFDNLSDAQQFSATLTEAYLRAAAKITRDALGDRRAAPTSEIYHLPRNGSQMAHVEGAPFGTRGGISVVYNFPADGEYSFRALMFGNSAGQLFGNMTPGEQLDVSIDWTRVALLDLNQWSSEWDAAGLNLNTGRIFVKAGPHRVSAAFLEKHSGLLDDNITPTEQTMAFQDVGNWNLLTVLPHLREFEIAGPLSVSGISEFESRRGVFTCRPLSPNEELPCATKIIKDLAARAYRRPATAEDLEGLMTFYDRGRKEEDFETGIRMAVQGILMNTKFVFRFEETPDSAKPGQVYRVSDIALASRLSYFLWNTLPDKELTSLAAQGKLRDPTVLERQVQRMLKDTRSESLATKFAGLWLHLPDLDTINPSASYYPEYDHTLGDAMKREIELFFGSVVREDRNVLDLLTANYSFVNERLARHYGIPNIVGDNFRRVELSDETRFGLLGKAGILTLTSLADRTSPVYRGKWVMGVLLGTPPPPPPPAVPKLEETSAVSEGRPLTVRERMEKHRASVSCSSCHKMIDPIGLALENFDVTGLWRTMDKTASINDEGIRVRSAGVPVDAKTQMYDGTPLDGPVTLRQALLKHSDAVIGNFTEKMMAYGLGRRIEYYDMSVIRSIARSAAMNNNRFSAFVLGIVKSPAFQMSKAETATDSAGGKH
jgi:hypothetical protein